VYGDGRGWEYADQKAPYTCGVEAGQFWRGEWVGCGGDGGRGRIGTTMGCRSGIACAGAGGRKGDGRGMEEWRREGEREGDRDGI